MRLKYIVLCLILLFCPITVFATVKFRFPLDVRNVSLKTYFSHGTGGCPPDPHSYYEPAVAWNCSCDAYYNSRTGYHHAGNDYAVSMGNLVRAAASGYVMYSEDGNPDSCAGSDEGNFVKIMHDDGTQTLYFHLKQGSVLVVQGEYVKCGDKIGEVGCSGATIGPHLHFEVRVGGKAIDPYQGACSDQSSRWVKQNAGDGLPSDECDDGIEPVQECPCLGCQ